MAVKTPAPERAAGRAALAKRKLALPDGSFPIPNGSYWDKARQAIGRVKDPAKRAAVAKLLRRTAPQFGKTRALKQSWAAPGGSSHSNGQLGIELARQAYTKHAGENVKCPFCGKYDEPDAIYCDQCGRKLPESAFANLSNPTVELAMPTNLPIRNPSDLVIVRGEGGHSVIIRHRAGGAEIGQIRRVGRNWQAQVGGKDLAPRNHQRTALADIIGTHNRGALTPQHRPASSDSAGPVLQPPAQQTPLMAQFGIQAERTFATPTTSSSSGGRMTSAAGDSDSNSDSGPSGLSPKGQQIYKKLKARGFPDARALAFAKRAQNFGGSK